MTPHRLQCLSEPGHDRLGRARLTCEKFLQVLALQVLDDREVGRTVSAVAVDETDRRDADAERVQPRVCGLEQADPETGGERVGEVVVALGRRPVGSRRRPTGRRSLWSRRPSPGGTRPSCSHPRPAQPPPTVARHPARPSPHPPTASASLLWVPRPQPPLRHSHNNPRNLRDPRRGGDWFVRVGLRTSSVCASRPRRPGRSRTPWPGTPRTPSRRPSGKRPRSRGRCPRRR